MMTESFRASPLDLPDAPRARAEIVPGTESHLALSPTEVIKVNYDSLTHSQGTI